jgi:hypothetical protein
MMVFFDMIDIASINAIDAWLYQNPDWNDKQTHCRHLFLTELRKA